METKLTPESSQISSIGYDAEKKIFEVVYKSNGSRYHYHNVSADLWEKAKAADSVGKFVGAYIKSHKFTKVG